MAVVLFRSVRQNPHATEVAPQSMKLLALILLVKILYCFKENPHATEVAPQSMKLLALILLVKILYCFKKTQPPQVA